MPDEEQYNAFTNLDPHNFQDISLKADGRYKFKMHVTFQIFWHFIRNVLLQAPFRAKYIVMVHAVVKERKHQQESGVGNEVMHNCFEVLIHHFQISCDEGGLVVASASECLPIH